MVLVVPGPWSLVVLVVPPQAPAVRALVPGLVCEEGEGAAITVQLPTQEEGS